MASSKAASEGADSVTSDRKSVEAGPAFLAGLTRPSVTSTLIMVAIPAVLLALAVLFFSPDVLASDRHRWIATGPGDDYVFLASQVLRLQRHEALTDTVILLGTSSTRIAIPGTDAVARPVSNALGQEAAVFNLASAGQYLWESWALIDMLPRQIDGVVVIGLSPARFWHGNEVLQEAMVSPRWPLKSDLLIHQAAQRGIQTPTYTGDYFWDHRRFFLPRVEFVVRNIIYRGPQKHTAGLMNRPPIPEAEWHRQVEEGRNSWGLYNENLNAGKEILRGIAEDLAVRGDTKILLMESPMNPKFLQEAYWHERYEAYQEEMRALASEIGARYCDLNQTIAVKTDLFYDRCHFDVPAAQENWAAALADEVILLMKDCPGEGQ